MTDSASSTKQAFRASILHFLDDPQVVGEEASYQYFEDGLLLVEDGRVVAVQGYATPSEEWELVDHTGKLLLPGFIDAHVHYPQTDMIAAHGEQLLEWLERYTFPTEQHFADPAYASEVANFFIDELLRNGTTTALVLGTVHPGSLDVFFSVCAERKLRMLAGKVLMDRNAPDYLTDTAQSSYDDSKALIERWHRKDRLDYAVTPRFAPTSTEEQLHLAGNLAEAFPDTYIHTHLAENRSEVAWVAELFPGCRSYLDVYDKHRLLRERSVFAHCLQLDDRDRQRLAEAGAAMAFCPTSNLFLGSGLFDMAAADRLGGRVALATDVGAGTSFSQLQTLNEAYKVLQMGGQSLSALRAFYLATLGSARALYLDHVIGNFIPGKEADFLLLDLASTPLIERRMRFCGDLKELLFVLMMLGDDRSIAATYILGEAAYQKATRDRE